jgi:uncharacterized protein YdhG (YjbR/CyaY superfamily)
MESAVGSLVAFSPSDEHMSTYPQSAVKSVGEFSLSS